MTVIYDSLCSLKKNQIIHKKNILHFSFIPDKSNHTHTWDDFYSRKFQANKKSITEMILNIWSVVIFDRHVKLKRF